MRRIFAVPDIHGEREKLEQLLDVLFNAAKLNLSEDLLIFLGDYVDRGPDSKGVLRILKGLQKEGAIIIYGNHEDMFVEAVEARHYRGLDKIRLHLMNGGDTTMASYSSTFKARQIYDSRYIMLSNIDAVQEDVMWLKTLPLWHETEKYFFSHAPVPSRLVHYDLAKVQKHVLIWSYGQPEDSFAKRIEGGKIGVCGHIHALAQKIKEPRIYDHYYYLDSGCGCDDSAPLVACELDSRTVYFNDGQIRQY